jgi:uncharacterized protein with PIN domain
MKFIADAMLGRLAKRLRLLGVDVRYDPAADDNEVLRRALSEERIILTRDRGLAARPLAGNCLFVRSDRADRQVEEVLAAHPSLRRQKPLTRCSACNGVLGPVARGEVRNLVPPHVLGTARSFLRCDACGRVYWEGSHVERMELRRRKGKRPAS